MRHLFIDTATRFTHIALTESGKIIAQMSKGDLPYQSEEALPLIISLLEEASIPLSSLDGVFIGIGPGTFTGTRVGVAIGKTIGFSLKTPCIPLCSLLCYEPLNPGPFIIVTDAKNKKSYTLKGEKKGNVCFYETEPSLRSYGEIETIYHEKREELLLIDPIGPLSEGAPWQINLERAIALAYQQWALERYTKAEEVSVLYLRTQADL